MTLQLQYNAVTEHLQDGKERERGRVTLTLPSEKQAKQACNVLCRNLLSIFLQEIRFSAKGTHTEVARTDGVPQRNGVEVQRRKHTQMHAGTIIHFTHDNGSVQCT